MRKRLLALTVVGAASLFFAVAPATGTIPGSSYQWQQPGTPPARTPHAQPRLPFATVRLTGLQYTSSSAYAWAQPGTAPVTVPNAQPW